MRRSTPRNLILALATMAGSIAASGACAAEIDVASLWSKNCASCHGKDAKGETKAGKEKGVKDLTDPKVRAEFKRDEMVKAVKDGIKDEKTGKDRMKPFGQKLDDAQTAALIDWVLALK